VEAGVQVAAAGRKAKAALSLAIAALPDVLKYTIQNLASCSSTDFAWYGTGKKHYRLFHPKSPCKITKELWSEIGEEFVVGRHISEDQYVLWAMADLCKIHTRAVQLT